MPVFAIRLLHLRVLIRFFLFSPCVATIGSEFIESRPLLHRDALMEGTRFEKLEPSKTGIDFEHQWTPSDKYAPKLDNAVAGGSVTIGDEQQLTHWHTFGFVTLRNLFTETEVETIHDEFKTGLAAEQVNYPGGQLPLYFSGLGSSTPFLATLPEDPRFLEPAEQIWGDDVISNGSMGQRFTNSNTYWHPDLIDGSHETKDNHIRGVKFACYLDALKPNSGLLD